MSRPNQNHPPPATPLRPYPSLDSIVPRARARPPSTRGRPPSSYATIIEDTSPFPSPSVGRPAHHPPTATLSGPLDTQPSCSVCGSTLIQDRTAKELQAMRQHPTDIVLSVVLDVKETVGGFLMKLFDHKRRHIASPRSCAALAAFLDGHTAAGTRPADVVEAIYRHPFGTQYNSTGQPLPIPPLFPSYTIPPPAPSTTLGDLASLSVTSNGEDSSSEECDSESGVIGVGESVRVREVGQPSSPGAPPEVNRSDELEGISDVEMRDESDEERERENDEPEQVIAEAVQVQSGVHSARAALQAWALSLVLHQIDLEARALTAEPALRSTNSAFTWDFLFNFSLDSIQQTIHATAPFLWIVLTTAAIGAGFRNGTHSGQTRDKAGRRRNHRNPWLACVIIVLILTYLRNRECNLFAAVTGTFLFSCRANSAVYAILGRCGITTSYSSTLRRLHSLGKSALSLLHDLASSPTESFLLLYDNINKQKRVWRHQLGLKDSVKSGTAATAIVLEDVEPGAFDAGPYYERLQQGLRQQLTIQTLVDDIRQDHLSNVAAANIAFILTKHIPSLRRHRPFVNHLIAERFAIHRLRLRKSRYYPMSTSGLDEATTAGNIKILFDLVVNQMKLAPSSLHRRLILVCGDLMTVNRLRTVKTYTKANLGEYDKHSWVLPMAQLWHLKWAFLKGIVKCHWAPQSGKHVFGLRRDAEALGRSINPKKCDFYPTHRLVEIVYESMVLHCARLLIREMLPPSTPPPSVKLQLLEELSLHFGPTGYFDAESLSGDDLFSLAVQIARRFTSNAALTDAEGSGFRSPLVYGKGPTPSGPSHWEDITVEGSGGDGDMSEVPGYTSATSSGEDSDNEAAAVDLRNIDPEGWQGDRVLYNATLFMINASWYYELHAATEDGDTGRIFEVLKVLRFFFWGSGAHNYGNELLHLACGFLYEFPDKLKRAILNNYLVNPSGLPGRWHPHDLLQEHQNFAIKRVFPDQDTDFDSRFLREVVAPNIASFGYLREGLYRLFGLFHGGNKRTAIDSAADINILGAHYLNDNVHVFCQGRRQPFASVDAFSCGFQKLEGGQLETFLDRTTEG